MRRGATATAVVLLVSVSACSSSSSGHPDASATTAFSTTTVAPGTTSTAPASATEAGWRLAEDFRRHHGSNPFAHAGGGRPVWSLRRSSSLDRTGTYPLLREYARALPPGVAAWHGANDACGGLPAIGVTASRAARVCGATVPENSVFVSPGPHEPAVVGWRSPIAGDVVIATGLADLDPRCGGNVPYWVDHGTTSLAQGEVVRNGSKTLPALRTPVAVGESIYFIVGPSARTRPGCDATQLQVTIAPAS
jgi:hypothetical protein